MKKLLVFGIAFIWTLQSFSQIWVIGGKRIEGNGIQTTREVTLPYEFKALKVIGNLDVTTTKNSVNRIIIVGDENLIEHIKIKHTDDGLLKIINPVKHQLIPSNGKKIKITIPYSMLKSISLSGTGKLRLTETINVNQLEITLRGSGSARVPINVSNVNAKISGSGTIRLLGKAETSCLKVRGTGAIQAQELETKNKEISVSGSGKITFADSMYPY